MGMPVIVSSGLTRDEAITDIIESVALEQTALSHILNAEGEKIQAVVAMEDVDLETLVAINTSVESMVKTITQLEAVLRSKLNLFSDCLCGEEEVIIKEEL
ncbi:hypothetical protein [Tannockella kyphosi]|uniref:hypothetical protein n=1 Tax=Tannockella kyphosi TaxID=2899121 RepID=UPI00201118BC|nr:hypothetical protein [Tannockella kyphosi]